MKKLILLAVPAMIMSCGPKQYTINGTVSAELEGKVVYLNNLQGEHIDSCTVTDSAFCFAGNTVEQVMYNINVEKKRASVMLQNGAKVTVDLKQTPASVTDNGGLNDKYNTFTQKISEASKALAEKRDSLLNAQVAPKEVREMINADIDSIYSMYHTAIKENKDNFVGACIVGMVARQFYGTIEEMDSVMTEVKYAKEIDAVKAHYNELKAAEATKEGKMFIDFAGLDLESKASKLSDYVGKGQWVLVDFWASWCGPCKAEIPNLIELQKTYGGEKFTVLGVNVWDMSEESFKNALKEEGITYPQIFIPRDNKDNATELYGIKGIPQIILFAPDGTIVKRNLRGEEMKAFVADQLK